MLGFDAIAALPISSLPIVVTPVPSFWGSKGGIGGKKKRKQHELPDEEVITTDLPEPSVMADQMRAIMLPPMDMLPSLVQARKDFSDIEARLEAKREAERDDEESILLLLM
jgi:hypothetical protein